MELSNASFGNVKAKADDVTAQEVEFAEQVMNTFLERRCCLFSAIKRLFGGVGSSEHRFLWVVNRNRFHREAGKV